MKLKYLFAALAVAVCLPAGARKKKTKEEEKPAETEYHKLTGRDSVAIDGIVGVAKHEDKYYLELPRTLLGKPFMVVNRMQSVPSELNEARVNKGVNYSYYIVSFELSEDLKTIRMRDERETPIVSPDQKIAPSVANNYANSVLTQWEVKALAPDSTTVLFPIQNLFDGNEPIINDIFHNIQIGQSASTKLTHVKSLKAYENNFVATSEYTTIVREGYESISIGVVATTSFCLLPETPLRGREADSRVGYFQTRRLFYKDRQQRPKELFFANRWRLEPSDPEAYMRGELTEPVKPITIYIDSATPEYLRPAIKQGIEDWNVAFEQAGFKRAIRAEVMSDTIADRDDDMKYSVLTYAASQEQNAMGPTVCDPRTGEILEADIIWWHNVTEIFTDWLRTQTSPYCEATRCLDMPDSLVTQAARFVASHEMGHSLGLRHNFLASDATPTDSLLSPTYVRSHNGLCVSIMDYARYNYVAQPGSGMPVLAPAIGVYDKFAIEWGYRWWPDEESERQGLKALIASHTDRVFRYSGDQATRTAIDPRAMSEDLGDSPMRSATLGLQNLKYIVPNIIRWTTTGQDNQSYEDASNMYLSVMSQWNRYSYHVLANVGGIYITNTVVGDGQRTFQHVEKARQREAVKWLIDNVFTYPAWLFNTDMSRLTYVVRHRGNQVVLQAPNQLYRFMLCYIIWDALDNARMMRMVDNELANGADAFTANDYMNMLHEGFFRETIAGKRIGVMQRYVQKTFVDALITAAASASAVKIDKNKAAQPHALLEAGDNDDQMALLAKELMRDLDRPMCCRHHVYAADITFDEYGKQVTRLSDPLTVKRGELTRLKTLLLQRVNTGDQATRDHYSDLLQRIETALAPIY